MKTLPLCLLSLLLSMVSFSQTVNIVVDAAQNRKPVSPYLYGKNNTLSDDPNYPLSASEWQKLRDAGIKLFRDNNGNNATKYNWRLKLSSHPDWYNNVYPHDWDFAAQSLQQNIPGARGMFAFQLIGKAAKTTAYNFNDWDYNGSAWTSEASNNWAGGGGPISVGGNGGVGDPNLYLMNWTADSTVGILDKWFGVGSGSLHLDQSAFQYWNMDNEPEIWYSTHDDVMPVQLTAEAFMQRYFDVAKKARARFPGIKLVGFVPCSEWFWFAYYINSSSSGKIDYNGGSYTWLEFFIKRIAEEQTASGIRLLDVLDIHTYFNVASEAELLQSHRIYFDRNWAYSGANGVALQQPGTNKEYIFGRANDLLTQYLGSGHGVTIGTTESGWGNFNQMPLALNYASTLGVFANEGVELFTPWYWSPSYWEVVHLFSRYSKTFSVKSTSSDDNNLSAYSTVSADNDSMTIVLVNRYATSKNTQVTLSNLTVTDGLYPVYTLKNLPGDNSTETFVSHTNNALVTSNAVVASNTLSFSLPAYSITSVILSSGAPGGDYLGVSSTTIELESKVDSAEFFIYSNIDWNVSSNRSWLTVDQTTGSNNGTIMVRATANKSIEPRIATITVSGTGVTSQNITVTQSAPKVYATEELVIYTDNETLIEDWWSDAGTLSEISTGAFEGTKHYRFNYSLRNWWSGYGLNLTDHGGNGSGYDFTKYESLKFAAQFTGPATPGIQLIDANGSIYTDVYAIEGMTNVYQEFTIPVTSFTGIVLDDVGEIMIYINGNSATGSGTFNIDNIRLGIRATMPNNLTLADTTLYLGETGCFDARDTIIVAGGDGSVEFRSGSSVSLIAEESIIFLNGFHAFEGSLVNASITTDGTFCDGGTSGSPVAVQPFKKSIVLLPANNKQVSVGKSIKVYPNPNRGRFVIDLNDFQNGATIQVYNLFGTMVYQSATTIHDHCKIDLPGLKKGIYLVKVTGQNEQLTKKISVI